MFRMLWIPVLMGAGCAAYGQSWVAGAGQIPALAVRGGTDLGGPALYICRTTDGQGLTQVGKFSSGLGCVYFYNGQALPAPSYQVLTDYSVSWQTGNNGSVPANSFQAATGPVYVCRAWVENSHQVGQLRNGANGCAIEFGGTGGVFANYEVLWSPWIASSGGNIPSGAVQTGSDSGGTLYTCRTLAGPRQIGKLRADFSGCRIGLNGTISVVPTYEVLVNFPIQWQSFNSAVPAGSAFFAGSSSSQPKYVCRFTIGGTSDITPGQAGGPSSEQPNQCKVEYFGSSKDSGSFEALVRPEPTPSCAYTVTPATINVPASGSSVTISVTSGCGWVNFPSESWLQTSTRTGMGNGTFILTIAANGSASPRTGIVSVGGRTITVNQAGGCAYAVSPLTTTIPASGGSRTFNVTATAGCTWSVPTNIPWLTPSPTGGTGSGVFTMQAALNTSTAARNASFTVAGYNVILTQQGVCAYTVTPGAVPTIAASGAVLTFTPSTSSSCTMNVTGPSWTTFAPAQPTGAFTVTVQTNSTYAARQGSLSVGNVQTIDLQQFGQSCNLTATPSAAQIPATGGSFTVQVSVAHSSCQWSVSPSSLSFVSFGAGSLSGQGNGVITGTALPAVQFRNGIMQISSYLSSQNVTVSQPGGGCSYSATPSTINLNTSAQTTVVNVTTATGCPVSFNLGASWLSYSGSGSGPGPYTLNVQANSTFATRTQIVTVGSAILSISQTGVPCSVTVTAPPTVASSGDTFVIPVSVPDPGCQWTASTTASFLHLNTPSGTGTGNITGSVDPNSAASARGGSVAVSSYLSNSTALVNQAGQSCNYTLTPASTTVSVSGGTRTFNITTASGCSWNAVSSDPTWVSFGGASSGNGTGSFTVTVGPNPNPNTRTGSVSAGGASATILQEASTCSYTLTSNGISIPAAGRSDSVGVSANAGCSWSATSPDSWVVINSGSNGSGNGTVAFTVLANPGTNSRASTTTIAGRSYVINQPGAEPGQLTSGLTFVSLAPCRILETRAEYNFEGRTGVFGPPFLTRGEVRTLPMNNSSLCPIPASAKAYVVNVTLVPRGNVDFVTLWPAGETRPNVWSVRSPDGNIVANSAIVKGGTGGGISLYVSDATEILMDVAGYYTDNPAISNLVYYPLTPCRVVDTRSDYRPPGPFGPPTMATRETRRFRFPGSPCMVPQGARAYSMTITAVPQGPLQYLTAWPAGGPQPNVSSINSPAGRVLANSVILPASTDGSIDVFTFNQTDFLVDINGYFAPDDGVNGLFYYPITQCRASDSLTNGGMYADNTIRTLTVPTAPGCTGIPLTARGYALNVTAMPGGQPMPFVTVYPTGQSRPNASVLNAFEGQIVTNSAIVPAGAGGAIDVYAYRQTHLVVEISGYFGR